jgi:hypothetical protein
MPTALEAGRVPGHAPTPVGARDRVARAFDLRQRCEQLGRHHRGGMLAEDRPVFSPRLRRRLGERAVQGKEQLGGLAQSLVHPVRRGKRRQDGDPGREDAKLERYAR